MARFQIITLVDITRTNPHRSETDKLKLAQQANFNSLIQAIGLRSNITWNTDPKFKTGILPNNIPGKANHWIWEFECEREDVFLKDTDPVGLLLEDLNGVPVIPRLTDDADIDLACFLSYGDRPNIWASQV